MEQHCGLITLMIPVIWEPFMLQIQFMMVGFGMQTIQGQTPATVLLLGGNVSGTVTLDSCVCMGPNDVITLTGDATIDGQGSSIHFATGVTQLIVPSGVTLTL